MAFKLRGPVQERAHESQKGFVHGRNFCSHVVALDAEARRAGILPRAEERMPTFTSYDFAAAFPSLSRTWLTCALRRFGLPIGYVWMFSALYFQPMTWIRLAGRRLRFLPVLAG
eukprot:7803418-Pyramimonas_sp.AAC.1